MLIPSTKLKSWLAAAVCWCALFRRIHSSPTPRCLKDHMQSHLLHAAHAALTNSYRYTLASKWIIVSRSTNRLNVMSEVSQSPPPPSSSSGLPDLSKPRYDQNTYVGRAKHFFETANPMNVFVSRKKLEEAAKLIRAYKWVNVPKMQKKLLLQWI